MSTLPNASVAPTGLVARAWNLRARALAITERLGWLPPLLARLVIGLVFVKTGWGKLHHLDTVVEYFRSLGIPRPELQAPFAATMEFACGLLVLVGLFTRLAAVPLIVIMIVALKTAFGDQLAKAGGGLDTLNELFGLAEFLYVTLLVWLALAGAGAVSLDRMLVARRAYGARHLSSPQ